MEKFYEQILAQIPSDINFGFITVKNETSQSFILTNNSPQSILFDVDSPTVYEIEPTHGVLDKTSKREFRVKIKPESAVVLVANAKLRLDKNDKYSKVIKFSSMAKFPNLRISKTNLDFGNVLIGKSKELELVINNPEKVPAKFTIRKKTKQQGKEIEQFILSDLAGEIPPETSFLLKVKYRTQYPNYFLSDIFEIRTLGGNRNRFTVSGNTQGLNTRINAKCVNFGSVELTDSMTKLIRIYNETDEPTHYQFFYQNTGPFNIKELEGEILGKSNVRVTITFKPRETMTYYDRVFCLIENHQLGVLDLYGSCHDLLNKSRILEQKHIDTFRYKLTQGHCFKISMRDEGIIETLLSSSSLNGKSFKKNLVIDKLSMDNMEEIVEENPNTPVQAHKELFWEATNPSRLFHANTDCIDFRCVENGKISEPYVVTLYNNSTERMKFKWLLDKQINTSNFTKNPNLLTENINFVVIPEEAVVAPKGRAEFKVYFKPNKPEFYFFAHLTCLGILLTEYDKKEISNKANDLIKGKNNSTNVLMMKSSFMKTYQTNEKVFEYFDPPVPLKVFVVGHSFPPGIQIFMPMMEIVPNKEIVFTPCSINQSNYQSLYIRNNSDTPLFYKFITDVTNIFRVYPKWGCISSKSFNLILLEFCPHKIDVFKFQQKIIFNHDSEEIHNLNLHGLCVDPYVELENITNEIYFPPCFIGINTKKTITVINKSPLSINVDFNISGTDNGIVNIEPNYFEMHPNEMRKVEISLCPFKNEDVQSELRMKASRIYEPRNEILGIFNPGCYFIKPDMDKRVFTKTFTVLGKGADGDLIVDPPMLQFETVKVGFPKKLSFSIKNPTICSFYVKLIFPEEYQDKSDIISLDFNEGFIHSLCQKDVNVTFKPTTRVRLSFKIALYATYDPTDKMVNNMINNHQFEAKSSLKAEIQIEANGNYPLIKIVDIRNNHIGTSKLWRNFNVKEINEELLKQLTEEEINYINSDKTTKVTQ
jgi:hypothetical protein